MKFLARLLGGAKPQPGAPLSSAATDPNTLIDIGFRHLQEGRPVEAATVLQQASRAAEASLGAEHRVVAKALSGVGLAYVHQGRHADAEAPWKRSLAIYVKALGPDDDIVVSSVMNLAKLYYDLKRPEDARRLVDSSSPKVKDHMRALVNSSR